MLPAHYPSPFATLRTPCLMGIVNITPDSFSDAGQFLDPHTAASHASQLAAHGARILDLGAEASSFFRPGIRPVPPDQQLQRLLPVLRELRLGGNHPLPDGVLISVDTRSAAVAQAAIAHGTQIINDVSGATHDPAILNIVAAHHAGIILMHMGASFPATPSADDADIVRTVTRALQHRAAAAISAGIPPQAIALDPGIGFGKTMADNWRLAAADWTDLARQCAGVVMGASRKRFLQTSAPPDVSLPERWNAQADALRDWAIRLHIPLHERDPLSAAVTALSARRGAGIHRVHEVRLAARALESAALY